MASQDYHFITHWKVTSDGMQVYKIIDNPIDLTRWWPNVYLEAHEIEPGDENGIGKVVSLLTKGWLPYTLRWQFRATEKILGQRLALDAFGDFVGRGIWTFEQDGNQVAITFDWKIRAAKPLLRRLSFLLKPVFSANHRWAMAQGRKALVREIDRLNRNH